MICRILVTLKISYLREMQLAQVVENIECSTMFTTLDPLTVTTADGNEDFTDNCLQPSCDSAEFSLCNAILHRLSVIAALLVQYIICLLTVLSFSSVPQKS